MSPDRLGSFSFYAVIAAWHEGDIIAATVANAFAQGCERVLLVDNDSPDDTVARATEAGAELMVTYSTDHYVERERLDIVNRVVGDVSEAEGASHIWWLYLDADEFPHGPRGLTLREYLESLDREYRVVGARFFDHYPDLSGAYMDADRHPLDVQPLCLEFSDHRFCARGHYKHPLIRWDRGGSLVEASNGFHVPISDERPLIEPAEPIFEHHFPFRNRYATRARLEELFGEDGSGGRANPTDPFTDHMAPRFASLDAVYRNDWANVLVHRGRTLVDGRTVGIDVPRPWTEYVRSDDVQVARWYQSP